MRARVSPTRKLLALLAALGAAPLGAVQEPISGAELVERARVAVGMRLDRFVERAVLVSTTVRRWEGQGANPDDAVSTDLIERVEALDAPTALGRLFTQRPPLGEVNWCLHSGVREGTLFSYDCLVGVATERPGPPDVAGLWWRAQVYGRLDWLLSDGMRLGDPRLIKDGNREFLALDIVDGAGVPSTMWFDPIDALPRRWQWHGADALGRAQQFSTEWDDYRDIGDGLLFPFVQRSYLPPGRREDTLFARVEVNVAPPAGLLAPDAGAARWTLPLERAARLQRLSDDVFLLLDVVAGYNSLAVALPQGWLLIEAPSGPGAVANIDRLLESARPGHPVRYVVPTHFHHDHAGNVEAFVRRGARLITTAGNVEFFRDLLGEEGGEIAVDVLESPTAFGATIELHPIAAAPHVDELIVATVAGAELAFTSDLFFLEASGHVRPAGPEASVLVRFLEDRPAIRVIATGHGPVAERVDLQSSLLRASPPSRARGEAMR